MSKYVTQTWHRETKKQQLARVRKELAQLPRYHFIKRMQYRRVIQWLEQTDER